MARDFLAWAMALSLASSVAAQHDATVAIPGTDTMVRVRDDGGVRHAAVRRGSGAWLPIADVDHRVRIRNLAFDPADPPPLSPLLMGRGPTELFLVQFETDILPEYHAAVERLGGHVVHYLPNQTYLVRAGGAARSAIDALDVVRVVTDYHPAYRLEPSLAADLLADRAAVGRYHVMLARPRVEAASVEAFIAEQGGEVFEPAGQSLRLAAELTRTQLLALANHDGVVWIEPWSGAETDNPNALQQSGATYLHTTVGLEGKGVRGHVYEGVDATHPEFAAIPPYRTTPIAYGTASPTGHGTNSAGVIFAQGLDPFAKGFLPFGQMIYTNLNTGNRVTMLQDLTDASQVYKAMFQTASWGSGRTTSYTSASANVDDALFQYDMFYTNSQSNAGNTLSRPEAWAKNACGIGAFFAFNNTNPADDCWCNGASIGPAADGRVGVSFVGYWDGLYTTASGGVYQVSYCCTSASTPMVTGLAGLAMEIYTDGLLGYPGGTWQDRFDRRPKSTTTRVLLAATSDQLPFANATRPQQGWGLPNVQTLYDNRDRILVLDEEDVLEQGESRTYFVWVPPGSPEFRASMHHLEPAALPSANPTRINSLDLQVTAPDGTVYWGNDAGLLSGPFSSGGGVPNDIDVHENVFLDSPASGVYQVTVQATAIRQDAHVETPEMDADFALAVAGIGGGRDRSGMILDMASSAAGDWRVTLSNVPASGWIGGVTAMSLNTGRDLSLGNLFGLEVDALTQNGIVSFPAEGNVFAFTPTANPSAYPNATFTFPVGVALAVKGLTFDAVAFLYGATAPVAVSNVTRVTIQ